MHAHTCCACMPSSMPGIETITATQFKELYEEEEGCYATWRVKVLIEMSLFFFRDDYGGGRCKKVCKKVKGKKGKGER